MWNKLTCSQVSTSFFKIFVLGLLFLSYCANAQLSTGFTDELAQSGYNNIMGAVFSDDGAQMFVWEKAGRVYVSNFDGTNYVKQVQPVLDISEEVGDWRDFGFMSFCLDPNFSSNGLVYMFYIVDRHHLMNFGTPNYNPNTNEYFQASISRVTRYQLNLGSAPLTTNYNTRTILLGESVSTGVPLTHESHAGGAILFGEDGTLIVTTGDNASYNTTDVGSISHTYFQQAINDGILRPEENVGAFRSQQITSLCGKVLRLDPNTGDGIPSNPHYEASNPRSPKSRMYAMGLRNPFRISILPGSGSSDPNDANPGVLFVADVGWYSWEDLHVFDKSGLNGGWPLYEGQTTMSSYWNANTTNPDENNERFKDNCLQPTSFVDNPNPALRRFIHNRPELAWRHGLDETRVPWFNGSNPTSPRIGATNSPTSGVEFRGNTSVSGLYVTGDALGSSMNGKYFFTDFIRNWIHVATLNDGSLNWVSNVSLFAPTNFGSGIVHMVQNPIDGSIYYSNIFNGELRRISFNGPTWVNEPTDVTLECDEAIDVTNEFNNWLSSVSGVVGCGAPTVNNNSTGLIVGCGNTAFEEVTFTLEDECGNEINKTVTFSVVDFTNPTWINEPTDINIDCDEDFQSQFESWLSSFSGIDNCNATSVTHNSDGLIECGESKQVMFTLQDECGNSILKPATFTVEMTLDISDESTQQILIYPNPADSHFIVSGMQSTAILNIYNITGQRIMDKMVVNNELVIFNIEAGLYLIKIETDKGTTVKRLIVE